MVKLRPVLVAHICFVFTGILLAQDRTIHIPSDQFDHKVYAASFSDRVTRTRDYDRVAVAQIIIEAYQQDHNTDANQLILSINQMQAEYDKQKQLANTTEGYQYFSKDDLHKADLMFKAGSHVPGVKPYSDLAKDIFDEEVYQVNKKLAPQAQIASQSEQYSLFARTQQTQDATSARLADLGANNAAAAKVIDHFFAEYVGASVTDKALVIAQGNPAFKDSQTLQYIAASVGPDGQINVNLEVFRAKYDGDMKRMFSAINQNRIALNEIRGRLRRIAKDKTKEQKDAEQRELTISAARASVFILASFIGDKKTAHDLSVAGNAVISMADAIDKYKAIAAAGSTESGLSAVIVTGNMLSGYMTIVSLFSDSSESPDAIILSSLREIQRTLVAMHEEMHYRFDRIDISLNQIYEGLLRALAQLDLEVGRLNGRVEDVQATLLEFELRLNRLQASMYFYLNDLSNRMTNKSVTYCLDFNELYAPAVLEEIDYRHCQADFLTWATSDSRDRLAGGLPSSMPGEVSFSGEIRQFPLPSKINLLMQVAAQLDDSYLPPSENLANPVVWAAGSEAYIQMARQSPGYYDTYPTEGLKRLVDTGEELESFLRRLAVKPFAKTSLPNYRLIDQLLSNYVKSTEPFVKNGLDIGNTFIQNEGHALDLWKDITQATTYSTDALNVPVQLNIPGETPVFLPMMAPMNALLPPAVLNAEQLGLGKISFSLYAAAVELSTTESKSDRGFVLYNAHYKIQVELDAAFDGKTVFRRIVTAQRSLPVCNAAAKDQGCDAPTLNAWLLGAVRAFWAEDINLRQLIITSSTNASDSTHEAVVKDLSERGTKRILQLRAAYYGKLATELSRKTPFRDSSEVVDGAKDLVELYLAFALPKSIDANEALHSAMFGVNGLLDTPRAIQLFSSSSKSAASQKKAVNVAAIIQVRSATLKKIVHQRLQELADRQRFEHQAVVEDTLSDLARLGSKHGSLKATLQNLSTQVSQASAPISH